MGKYEYCKYELLETLFLKISIVAKHDIIIRVLQNGM